MNTIHHQYANSSNLVARIELNRLFQTNPYPWTRWIYDQIEFPERLRILELGCGNGILWKSNLDRIPPEAHILLSDFSKGMLNDTQDMLKPSADRFHYQVLDAQEIPYEDNSLDIALPIIKNKKYFVKL